MGELPVQDAAEDKDIGNFGWVLDFQMYNKILNASDQ